MHHIVKMYSDSDDEDYSDGTFYMMPISKVNRLLPEYKETYEKMERALHVGIYWRASYGNNDVVIGFHMPAGSPRFTVKLNEPNCCGVVRIVYGIGDEEPPKACSTLEELLNTIKKELSRFIAPNGPTNEQEEQTSRS